MEGFLQAIIDLLAKFFGAIADFIIMILNFLIAGIGIVLSWIVKLFPDSPFSKPAGAEESINLGYITWLIPFPDMIKHGLLLCAAALTYYGIRVLARWIKLTRS